MAQKLTSLKAKIGRKKLSADTLKKVTKSKLSLKGNEMAGYVLLIQNGDWSDDIQITSEELRKLYCILSNMFGEFMGYKIK